MLQSVNCSFQNLIFIRIEQPEMVIDRLAKSAQISIIMIIEIEYSIIIKFIVKIIDIK